MLTLLFCLMCSSCSSKKVVIPRERVGLLDEAEALRISENALARTGIERSDFVLRPFDGTNFYARNHLNPMNGYVLWQNRAKRFAGYCVDLTVEGTNVVCEVVPTH